MFTKFWIDGFSKLTLLLLQYFGQIDYRLWWEILLCGTKHLTFNRVQPTNPQMFLWALQRNVAFSKLGRPQHVATNISMVFDSGSCSLETGFPPELPVFLIRTELLFSPWPTSHILRIFSFGCQTEEKSRGSYRRYIYSLSRRDISIKRAELFPDTVKVSWSCQGRCSFKKYGFWQNKQKFSMGTEQPKRLFSLYFRQTVQC